jgi:hypothetical protein
VTTRTVRAKKGLSVKTFSGLSKSRMAPKSNSFGMRTRLDTGTPVPVQFYGAPDSDTFVEYDTHVFKEDGKWVYVPCLGDACPLCQDEDRDRSKTTYRFVASVYNLKEKKAELLEGPKDLANRVFYRYERKKAMFLKRTFEITKLDTTPVQYDVAQGDEDPVSLRNIKALDPNEYIETQAKQYYGENGPSVKTALDEDDDEDLADDDVTEDEDMSTEDELREELEALTLAKLKVRAKEEGGSVADIKGKQKPALIDLIVDLVIPEDDDDEDEEDEDEDEEDLDTEDDDLDDEEDDDDEDDEDEEDEDDEDEEDEPPARARRAPAKKAAAARKAPARRARR